jgi:hypothetical protein
MALSLVATVALAVILFVQDYRYRRKMDRLKARMYRGRKDSI